MKVDFDVRWLVVLALLACPLWISPVWGQTAIDACGKSISKSGTYLVTGNLTAAGQDCITITVNNVAIDLKGHTLTGDGTHSGITDGGHAIAYIIIANGKITGFDTGIDLSGQSAQVVNQLLNLNVSNNAGNGIKLGGSDSVLYKVTASSNGADGIDGESNGGCCNDFTKVVTNGNGADGVELTGRQQWFVNQTATGNAGDGVFDDGGGNTVVSSMVSSNGAAGVDFPNNTISSAISTTANGNHDDGIDLGQYAQAIDSTASNNGGNGIDFSQTQGIAANVVTNANSLDGVFLKCQGNAFKVSAHGNGTNLEEDNSDGTCTNARNSAP